MEGAAAARRDADADLAFEEERRVAAEAAGSLVLKAAVRAERDAFATFQKGDPSSCVVLDARPAHAALRSRFEGWVGELGGECARRCAANAKTVETAASSARARLEAVDERRCSCRDALGALALHAALTEALPAWRATCDGLERAEASLKARRLDLEKATDHAWIEASRVRGAVDACAQILERKKGRLDAEKAALRAEADAELVQARMAAAAIAESWRTLKPERLTLEEGDEGFATPAQASERLDRVLGRVDAALEDARDFRRALAALGDENDGEDAGAGLDAIRAEALALKDAWAAVSGPAATIQAVDKTRWTAFDPAHARDKLREADDALRKAPAKARQHARPRGTFSYGP